jgi:hypothetical protein
MTATADTFEDRLLDALLDRFDALAYQPMAGHRAGAASGLDSTLHRSADRPACRCRGSVAKPRPAEYVAAGQTPRIIDSGSRTNRLDRAAHLSHTSPDLGG